jgi:hypothetical protein
MPCVSRNVPELQIVSKSSVESAIRLADASSNMVWSNLDIAATKMIALVPSHRRARTNERTNDRTARPTQPPGAARRR